MKLKTSITSIVCLFLIGICSCKKSTGPSFNFENTQGIDINFDVYATQDDYINAANVLYHMRIPANGSVNLPVAKLHAGSWYYYDTYSDDYSFTNWVDDDNFIIGSDSATPKRFKYVGNDAVMVAQAPQTSARLSLLSNTKTSSTWTAVNAVELTSNNSTWYSLSANQQYAKVIVRKNHTGTFYYISGTDTVSADFTFGSLVSTYPQYDIIINELALNFFFDNTTVNPDPGVSLYQPTSVDSAVTLINGNLYIVAKQN